MIVIGLAAAVLAGLAPIARAEVRDVPDVSGPIPDDTLRGELGVAFEAGGMGVGGYTDLAGGVDAHAALRLDRVLVQVREGVLIASRANSRLDPDHSYTTRLGADVRLSAVRDRVLVYTRRGRPAQYVRRDVWVGAGVGRESIHAGFGDLDRSDVAIELGYSSLLHQRPDSGTYVQGSIGIEVDTARGSHGYDHAVLVTFAFAAGI